MRSSHISVRMLGLCLLVAGIASGQTTSTGSGQAYPNKPIRIVTAEAGGGADLLTRTFAPGVAAALGQQVIVENRGGAGGVIATETVARAAPDGYTLLLYSNGVWVLPLLQTVSFDPVKDFAAITLADRAPNVLVVHPSLPVKSARELIALARSRPGQLNYAMGGTGGSSHLAAELFKSMAGVNIVRIAYKGTGPALKDVVGGQVQVMFSTPASVAPQVKANRLRALAVTSAEPSALAPGLPTVASSGLPGYEAESAHGIFAPAGTSRAIVTRLNEEIVRVLNRAETRERFMSAGVEVVAGSPESFAATIKSDMARLGKVIRDAGIKAD